MTPSLDRCIWLLLLHQLASNIKPDSENITSYDNTWMISDVLSFSMINVCINYNITANQVQIHPWSHWDFIYNFLLGQLVLPPWLYIHHSSVETDNLLRFQKISVTLYKSWIQFVTYISHLSNCFIMCLDCWLDDMGVPANPSIALYSSYYSYMQFHNSVL